LYNNDLIELERRGAMPTLDFANPLHNFASTLTYTARKECYLYGQIGNFALGVSCDITINNTSVGKAHTTLDDQGRGYCVETFIPTTKLAVGDVVTVSTTSPKLYVLEEA
jgi:hypothetical protein